MFGQIWSTLTRKPLSPKGELGPQLEPVLEYRLAMYVAAARQPSETHGPAGSTFVRKFGSSTGS